MSETSPRSKKAAPAEAATSAKTTEDTAELKTTTVKAPGDKVVQGVSGGNDVEIERVERPSRTAIRAVPREHGGGWDGSPPDPSDR
jgi:hypothetical protein